jgi:hypothetical protein
MTLWLPLLNVIMYINEGEKKLVSVPCLRARGLFGNIFLYNVYIYYIQHNTQYLLMYVIMAIEH